MEKVYITYDLSVPAPRLLVTPGVKFTIGLVLTYDDMPTLSVPLILADDGTVGLGGPVTCQGRS